MGTIAESIQLDMKTPGFKLAEIPTNKKGKRQEEEPFTPTNSLIFENRLYEQVVVEGKLCFAFQHKDVFEFTLRIDDAKNETVYVPQSGEELSKQVVLLPSSPSIQILVEQQAGDHSGVLEVLGEVQAFIHKYCDLPKKYEDLIPYWVLGTYVYDQLDQFPILSFQGDMGTGKSRCKDVIGSICYTPIRCNGGISAAAMYRLIDKWKGTLLMDEADFGNSDETSDVIKLLNCGFERRSPIAKCDLDDKFKLLFFNPYCPKIVTRRKEWNDKATESRCINIISQQTVRKDVPIVLPPMFERDAQALRSKLIAFRLAFWRTFTNPIENPLVGLPIEPRLAQTCTSLAIVVFPFKQAMARFKEIVIDMQRELIEVRADTMEGALVQTYNGMKGEGKEVITPTELCLSASEVYGEEIKPRSAGKYLKSLGFVSKYVRRSGFVCKNLIISEERWGVLKQRYIVPDFNSATSATSATTLRESVTLQQGKGLSLNLGGVQRQGTLSHSDVADVADVAKQVLQFLLIAKNGTKHLLSFQELKNQINNPTDEVLIDALAHLMTNAQVYEPKKDHYEVLT